MMIKKVLIALTIPLLCLLLSGCVGPGGGPPVMGTAAASSGAPPEPEGTPILFLFVLDETGSFCANWNDSVAMVAKAVVNMRPGDAILVLGLDNHAWDADDVRVKFTVLPGGALRSAQAKASLVTTIRALQPRPSSSGYLVNGKPRNTPPGTDTIGIIDMAASLATKDAGTIPVHVTVFSDFEDELVRSTGASKSLAAASRTSTPTNQALIAFPPRTRFTACYVAFHSHDEVQKRIDHWVKILQSMQVNCTDHDFYFASDASKAPIGRVAGH